MIIDFHTHIFPKEIRENREKHFNSEPAFKLLYSLPGSKMSGAKEIISTMDDEGVDMSVVFGFPWTNPDTFKKHNDYIIESVAEFPDRLRGFGCFDLFNDTAPSEAERCIKEGLSGIGELAFYKSGIDGESIKRLTPVMEIALADDLPVMIHTNEPVGHYYPGKTTNTLMQIYTMVKSFPSNKIVLAHWGGGIFFYNLLKKDVKESLKNVYFDTAASPFLYEPAIYMHSKNIIGIEKILFGTDFPLLKPARYFNEIEASGISKNDIKAICGENAKKILGIK